MSGSAYGDRRGQSFRQRQVAVLRFDEKRPAIASHHRQRRCGGGRLPGGTPAPPDDRSSARLLIGPAVPDASQEKQASRGPFSSPSISLPNGGGAIRGIGEKFSANPATGTGSLSIPIAISPGRSGFGPQLALDYDSGSGNGPFGLGWSLSLPAITRKTDKGLPKYRDDDESDVFILSGAEDLVPQLDRIGDEWQPDVSKRTVSSVEYLVKRYRPRVEGLFA